MKIGGARVREARCLRQNVGSVDRYIRGGVAIALIVYPGLAGWPVPWIAILAAVGGAQFIAMLTGY